MSFVNVYILCICLPTLQRILTQYHSVSGNKKESCAQDSPPAAGLPRQPSSTPPQGDPARRAFYTIGNSEGLSYGIKKLSLAKLSKRVVILHTIFLYPAGQWREGYVSSSHNGRPLHFCFSETALTSCDLKWYPPQLPSLPQKVSLLCQWLQI